VKPHGLVPILNVSSMEGSFAWFEKLGWSKAWDWGNPPDFGGVCAGHQQIFLCLDGQGGRGRDGVWLAFGVENVDEAHRECLAQGIEVLESPTDRPWNLREMLVRHPDGHMFRIGHHLEEEK
jgi:catechol 2,3-dioxygenase-like lactoylglutathione lyase family enzyme